MIPEGADVSIHDLVARTGATANTLRPRLRVLVSAGALEATASPQSRNRKYRRPNASALADGL